MRRLLAIVGLIILVPWAGAAEVTQPTAHGDTRIMFVKVEGQLVLAGRNGGQALFQEVPGDSVRGAAAASTLQTDGRRRRLTFTNIPFTPKNFELQFGADAVITLAHNAPDEEDPCSWTQQIRHRDTMNNGGTWSAWADDKTPQSAHPDHRTHDRPSQSVELGMQTAPEGPRDNPVALVFTPEQAPAAMATVLKTMYAGQRREIEAELHTTLTCRAAAVGTWTWGYLNVYDGQGTWGVTVTAKTPVWTAAN